MIEIKITKENAGGRLDKYIFRYLDKAPQSFVYKMLRKKNIVLNGKKAAGSELLCDGDCIKLFLADETIQKFRSERRQINRCDQMSAVYLPTDFSERIVFEDENIIAFDKPAGMLSQKAGKDDVSLNEYLMGYYLTEIKRREKNNSDAECLAFKPGIVNRLDRNTSGIVLFPKNSAAARELSYAVKERCISKKYLTLVYDYPADKLCQGFIIKEGWLVKNEINNRVTVFDINDFEDAADECNRYRIQTGYRVLASADGLSLLEVDLITGRPHQIRAHMAFLGHPVIGDIKYGNERINHYFRKKYGLNHQLLHAFKMDFNDMKGILSYLNGRVIKAPVPNKLKKILEDEHIWQHGEAEV